MSDLSPREAAVELGVHVETVRRLIRRRKLVAHRVGPRLRVNRAEVDRYRKANAISAPDPGPAPLPARGSAERGSLAALRKIEAERGAA